MVVAAPALLLGGVLLMSVPQTWTAAHLVFLAGTLLMAPAALVLHARLAGTTPAWLRGAGLALSTAGALALAGQFLVDIVVLQLAGGDGELAGPIFDRLRASPAIELILYSAGPALLFTGLAASGAAVVRSGRRSGWLLVAGSLAMGLGRITGERAVEVVALGMIVAALALTTRRSRA